MNVASQRFGLLLCRHGYLRSVLSSTGERSQVQLADRETLWVALGRGQEPELSVTTLPSTLGICSSSCDFLLSCVAAHLRVHDKVSDKALSKNGLLYQVAKSSCGLTHMTLYEFWHFPSRHFVYDEVLDRLAEVDCLHELLCSPSHSGVAVKSFFIQSHSGRTSETSLSQVMPYSGIGHVVGHCQVCQQSEAISQLFTDRRNTQKMKESLRTDCQHNTTYTYCNAFRTCASTVGSHSLLHTPPCLYVGSRDDPR